MVASFPWILRASLPLRSKPLDTNAPLTSLCQRAMAWPYLVASQPLSLTFSVWDHRHHHLTPDLFHYLQRCIDPDPSGRTSPARTFENKEHSFQIQQSIRGLGSSKEHPNRDSHEEKFHPCGPFPVSGPSPSP